MQETCGCVTASRLLVAKLTIKSLFTNKHGPEKEWGNAFNTWQKYLLYFRDNLYLNACLLERAKIGVTSQFYPQFSPMSD